jgi:hypothetical protein
VRERVGVREEARYLIIGSGTGVRGAAGGAGGGHLSRDREVVLVEDSAVEDDDEARSARRARSARKLTWASAPHSRPVRTASEAAVRGGRRSTMPRWPIGSKSRCPPPPDLDGG